MLVKQIKTPIRFCKKSGEMAVADGAAVAARAAETIIITAAAGATSIAATVGIIAIMMVSMIGAIWLCRSLLVEL
jgi:hypothetical protein